MVRVPVFVAGSEMVAVSVFAPVEPVRTRSLNSIAPSTACLVVVPESVDRLAERTTFWLAAVPEVTRFPSRS